MSKTKKIIISILSIVFALSMVMFTACANKETIEIKTVPPVVQHRVGESINLYDYVERQAGVEYSFTVAHEDGDAKATEANGYYLSETGNYTITITAKKGGATATASLSFNVVEVAPTVWAQESVLQYYWLNYTVLYKLLDEISPMVMPLEGVTKALTHVYMYPAEDDSYGYKIDLTGTQSYIEEFKTANPDVLTRIELTDENVNDYGFYVYRRKAIDDQSPIKSSDGKYYGVKDMEGLFMFLREGIYEFHYSAKNTGGEKTGKFYVNCTEKLFELNEIEGGLSFDRETFIATWKPVPGAVQYKVKLLDKNYFVEDTTFDCSEIIKNRIMDFTLVVLPIGENQTAQNDYVNDSKMTYETPYIGSAGTTLNDDDSITIKGTNPPGELYLNIAGTVNDYYALRGDFGVGNFIDIVFKGNNMPTVLLFADEINGDLSFKGGNGIALVGGFTDSLDGGKTYFGSSNVYGPNRMNTHYSYSPVARLNAAMTQTKYLEREQNAETAGMTYRYTVGTRVDSDGQLIIVAELYDNDTGALLGATDSTMYYWYDAARDPKALNNPRNLKEDDVKPGHIVLYGAWKTNAEETTILSVSDPYFVDPRAVIENEDGSVSLKSAIPGGTLYGSFNGTSNSYVAHDGEYGVGTFVDFYFKGNNMPSVMMFADEPNSIMGFKGGKGIIAVSGIIARDYLDNPWHETDNPTGVKPSNSSVKIFGPNRVNMHYTYADLARYGEQFAQAELVKNPDRNYKYTVGTRVDDEGYLRWVAELYDADTGVMLQNADLRLLHKFDMEIPNDANTPETEWDIEDRYLTPDDVKAGAIVAYAQFKGTTEERTTFKMSEPYYPDTEVSKGSAADNGDGSYTLQGANTTLLYTGPGASTGKLGWVAHNGNYGVGTFVEYTFKGNNMPQVMLFANNMDGNMSGNSKGYGVLLLNGIRNSTDTEGVVTHGGNIVNFQIYGPNRMSGNFPGDSSYRNADANFALNQNSLIAAGDDVEYRYVVGTKVVFEDRNLAAPVDGNWVGQDGFVDAILYVVAELYNKETGELLGSIETPLMSTYNAFDKATVNKYLTVSDVPQGHIVAFATLKGLNDDGSVASTTFTLSKKPYKLEEDASEHKHVFTKLASDENIHWYECEDEACDAKFGPVAHTGGEATCTEQAKCDVCDASYGELKPHVGGTATCTEAATCEVCGNKYGTFGHDYTTAVEGTITVVDDKYHTYKCGKCGEMSENEAHFGGEATYEEQAKCTLCGAGYGEYKKPESSEQITINRAADITAHLFDEKRTLTTESGSFTLESDIAEPQWQNTSSVILKKQYTDEFIKIGFTALAGDGSTVNLHTAMGFVVGFRKTSDSEVNPVVSDWIFKPNDDTNYGYFYNKAANAFAMGHGATAIGNVTKLKLVEGKQYYFMLGVTGKGTDSEMFAFWLDENEALLGGMRVTMSKFTSVRPNGVMTDSGYFGIYPYAKELTVSYEILDADTALDAAGIHTHRFETLEKDEKYHWYSCRCEELSEKVAHSGGTFNPEGYATCEVCGQEYKESNTNHEAEGVNYLNLSGVSATEQISVTKGAITATAYTDADGGINRGKAGSIVLDGTYTDEFVKVGFTAVADANTTTYASEAMDISVGVRGVSTDNGTRNWTTVFWGNGNGAYLMKDYNVRGHYGAYTTQGATAWASVTKGTEYYILTGIVGAGDDAVYHWYWLDASGNILRGLTATAAQIAAKTTIPLDASGVFTIHDWSAEERTISWEILDAETALESVGVHVHKYNTLKTDDKYHWNECSCGEADKKVAHFGGEADANGKAKCEVCETEYDVLAVENISFINVAKSTFAEGSNTTKGTVTIAAESSATNRNTATIVVEGEYTNEFIKVGFTALESGAGRTYMTDKTLGLTVGVRGVASADNLKNYSMSPWGNTNWLYMTGNLGTISHLGGLSNRVTNKHWDGIVKGETYYIVVGIVGSDYNKSTATTDDDAVFYWMILDKDNSLRASVTVTAEELLSKKPAATISASGVFTIHELSNTERTFTYEIIDSATALGYMG